MQLLQFCCFKGKNVPKTPKPTLNPRPLTKHKSPSGGILAAIVGTDEGLGQN